MMKILKNQKGMSLVNVIIIMTVLVVLCGVLAEAVMYNLVATKRSRNIDMAYYAGESAVEKWTGQISVITGDPSLLTGLSVDLGNNIGSFANSILSEIDSKLTKSLQVVVEGNSTDMANVDLDGLELVSAMANGNYLEIEIGIRASASYAPVDTNYTASAKEVYAVKKFSIQCPIKDCLDSAIYAVGDIYVNGENNTNTNAVVKGDVYSFGSFAENPVSNDQCYNGGLLAMNKGNIRIYGNAYSRSFIRTGLYWADKASVTANGDSEIRVYKDAVAECVQDFGNNDRIIVMRNAYTFDDLEMNGSNSVIAVNGSFFGLSRGGSTHDGSSGIVNSSLIHGQLSADSFKSRIVINGDVLMAGGTFKVETDGATEGQSIGQIEDASVAWNEDEKVPHYKFFDWEINKDDAGAYHTDLINSLSSLTAYLNQFQIWNSINLDDPQKIEQDTNVWLANIDDERQYGIGANAGNYTNGNVPNTINGFCFYEMAANNKLYNGIMHGAAAVDTDITNLGIKDKYVLDNIFDNNQVLYGMDYFNVTVIDDLIDIVGNNSNDTKLESVEKKLKERVHKYATRDKTGASVTTAFGDMLNKLIALPSGSNYLCYADDPADSSDIIIDPGVYTACATDRDKNYYLLVNADPDRDIHIDNVFNGLIVTAGKIYLDSNADIYGSIIAAGGGSYNASGFEPELHSVKDDTQRNELYNGDYAAVIIQNCSPKVDFYLGKLADPFVTSDVVDFVNKAYNILKGRSVFPVDFSSYTDVQRTPYLNRAARTELLNKLDLVGIDLYDIF